MQHGREPSDLFNYLSDAVIICDCSGKIRWQNDAAALLRPGLQSIDHILAPADCARLLKAEAVEAFETLLHLENSMGMRFSVVCCRCSAAEPEGSSLILLLKSQPLKQASEENDINSLVHDIKNPLGAIFGYADALIESALGDGLSQKQRDIISRVRGTAVRSIELVKNLQQLHSLSRQEPLYTSRETDLNLVTEAVLKGTWQDRSKNLEVGIKLFNSPLNSNVEKIILDRVISNLISNAFKFTPTGGRIDISTFASEQFVAIRVANNLPVVPGEELSRIFEKRFRGSGSSGISGSGLGLYIVREILDKIGGRIEAESTKQSGTAFTAFFPGTKPGA